MPSFTATFLSPKGTSFPCHTYTSLPKSNTKTCYRTSELDERNREDGQVLGCYQQKHFLSAPLQMGFEHVSLPFNILFLTLLENSRDHGRNGCYLFRVKQGDTGDGGPGIFMRHQFVSLESVHTVRVQHPTLVHLVLIWLTSSCNTDHRMSSGVSRLTGRPKASVQRCLGPLYCAFPPSRFQNSVAQRLSVLMPSSSTVTWGALQPRSLLV